MIKTFARRVSKLLLRHGPDVSLATSAQLPWPLKETLARIEMATRSVIDLKVRASFLRYAWHLEPCPMPDRLCYGPIWQYWNAGLAGCPPIIRECMASVRRHTMGREILVLTDENLHDFVTLPPHALAKREQIGATHFSELLRVSLLAQHGGTWIDASVLLTGRIDDLTSTLPFFAFRRANDPYMVSSWFIHAAAGHPLACAMRDLLTAYWVTQDKVQEYFMFHFLFESAITLHAGLRGMWQKTPTVLAEWRLQDAINDGSNFDRLKELAGRAPVHKLTWKFSERAMREAVRIAEWTTNLGPGAISHQAKKQSPISSQGE
jgi:hypothetical protein